MNSCAITDKGIVRRQNQDAVFTFCDETSGRALLIVCDGMGGAKAGNVASELTIKVFAEEIKKKILSCSDANICDVLKNALKTANTAVHELSRSDQDCAGMGTTIVSAVVIDDSVYVLNVGDSRAYLISDKEIYQITRDHSVVEDMIRRGDITREESRNHPNKNLITRAVGTVSSVECDIFYVRIKESNSIFLCSDGLSNVVSDMEMFNAVKNSGSIDVACRELIDLALSRGAPDNVSVVLFNK